jgi:diaminopimelate epimerase
MQFTKLQGAGNDFVLVDARGVDQDWPALAKRICDRHFGVGADGLLVLLGSEQADICMREFNPDGSEPEMCGNGIRCFTKYVLERDIVPKASIIRIETGAGILAVEPFWEGDHVIRVKVNMGEPDLRWKTIPVNTYEASTRDDRLLDPDVVTQMGLSRKDVFFDGRLMVTGQGSDLVVTAVSMGNPHAVQFIDTPVRDYPLHDIGPDVEFNMAFPTRVNYHVVNVVDKEHILARSWERGVGETLACGTGACAMVVAARLHRYVGDTVQVSVPGGELIITWTGSGPVFMEGPAEVVFTGEWPE